jgi:hypothetical protein
MKIFFMASSHDAPSPAPPFLLDSDLLLGNLEVKRVEGFPCPHCNQTMEWNLGPATKGAIIDALAQGDFHEAFFFCDKDDCPSVQRDGNNSLVNPFVRRISAQDDGTIVIETLPLKGLLKDVASFRQLSRVATREGVARETAHRQEIDDLRRGFEERLSAAAAGTIAAQERMGRLEADRARLIEEIRNDARERIDEMNREVARAEAELRQAREENAGLTTEVEEKGRQLNTARQELERLVQEAQQMEEACRLAQTTPDQILAKARSWAAKHGGRR